MINTEFLKARNLFTLSIIILLWITIHDKLVKPHLIRDGAK